MSPEIANRQDMTAGESKGWSYRLPGVAVAPRPALAQEWAQALWTTAYLPFSVDEFEQSLLELVDGIVDDLAAGNGGGKAAAADVAASIGLAVGARLG